MLRWVYSLFKRKRKMKKFDIIKYTQSANGGVTQKEESGVMSPDRDTLIMLYEGCGDKIKILREYEDDESKAKQLPVTADAQPSNDNGQSSIPDIPSATPRPPIQFQKPPMFFKIGDISCKLENGKIYQKQWMRVSKREADELRIINDANNKIFPLTGKHIEMLKWVLTDEPQDEAIQPSQTTIDDVDENA